MGAHEGVFTKKLSKIFSSATFLLVEGNPEKLPGLAGFVSQDPTRFKLQGVLLGAVADVVKFHIMEGETGSSVFLEQSNLSHRIVEVPQVRLSDIISVNERPSLIKLDVQGYESQVLKGIDRCVNTGRKIPKTSVENSPVLQAILIMAALSSGVLRP